jgi:hypothetical protein
MANAEDQLELAITVAALANLMIAEPYVAEGLPPWIFSPRLNAGRLRAATRRATHAIDSTLQHRPA